MMAPLTGESVDILPTPPNEESSFESTSATNLLQSQRLQQYLTKIKRVINDRVQTKNGDEISTLDALEETLHILNSVSSPTPMDKCKPTPAYNEEKPLSPAETSWSSETDQNSQSISVADTKTEPAEEPSQDSTCIKPSWPSTMSSNCNRLLATVFLDLPQGTVREVLPNTPNIQDSHQICGVLKKGGSFLAALEGKGAQTMLLNAFYGHSKRRMYARIKCTDKVAPFELLCEFAPTGKGPTCTARVQILRLESILQQDGSTTTHSAVFTTRHNTSGAVIYLDSASIPFLGHFPSEITGRSVFSLIHVDEVERVKQAHAQLLSNGGKIVAVPKLRMVSYGGDVVYTDSQWAAFVNPWTKQIEMVVGRHSIICQATKSLHEAPVSRIADEQLRVLDSETRHLLSCPVSCIQEPVQLKPVATVSSYIDKIVEALVNDPNEQPQDLTGSRISPPTAESPQSGVSLSYTQINCLENVNRLLKSQNNTEIRNQLNLTAATSRLSQEKVPLTQEILQKHNEKWEEECKYTWKQRLSHKRAADNASRPLELEVKIARLDSNIRSQVASPMSFQGLPSQSLLNFNQSTYPLQPQQLFPSTLSIGAQLHLDQSAYTKLWMDYLNAMQAQAQNPNLSLR